MANPFTTKARQGAKLKPFGAVKSSPKVNGTKPANANPFTLRAQGVDNSVAGRIKRVKGEIANADKELRAAVKAEAKAFQKLDKLETRGKHGTTAHDEAKAAWNAAWREIDRFNNALMSYCDQLRRLGHGL